MRADLLDAHAGIEWAYSQLKVLEARIETWQKLPPYEIVAEIDTKRSQKIYKLANVQPLPPIVNAEAGLIINSLRSSLDVLANTLAMRHGHADPKGTQFPICPSASAFRQGKHAGRKEIKLLAAADQKIIEDLQPWAGGHPHLFDIHTLDIVRKHRQLLRTHAAPVQWSIGEITRKNGFRFPGAWIGFKNGAIVGRSKIDAPDPDIQLSLSVALMEGRTFPALALLEILNKFTRSAADIINLFG